MFEIVDNIPEGAEIKVIGVGGGGGNAVKHMIESQVVGVDFICANTDSQALQDIAGATLLQLGNGLTKGLGAGADPEIGRQAAMDDRDRIAEVLDGADMVFVTAGMGGGTGTGAAPVVADVARELGILTVAVVTRPFRFEGRKRMAIAEEGINELKDRVDSLIAVPNEKLLTVLGKSISLIDAFKEANNVLLGAVQGIADLIIRAGEINVDFADVRTVMSEMGMAMMGSGQATGENRAREAAEAAVQSPLLEDIDLRGAKGILVNISASADLSLGEFTDVGDTIEEFASEDATVVVGTVIDAELEDELRVTVVATGLCRPDEVRRPIATKVIDNSIRPGGELDYGKLDRPTVTRRPRGRVASAPAVATSIRNSTHEAERPMERGLDSPRAEPKKEMDMDYLDIPAFLRHQSD